MLNQASAFFAIDLCMRKKGKLRRTATTNRLFYLRHTYKICLWFWKQNKKLNSLNFIMRQLRAVRSVPAQMDFLGRNCYYLPTSVRRQCAGWKFANKKKLITIIFDYHRMSIHIISIRYQFWTLFTLTHTHTHAQTLHTQF